VFTSKHSARETVCWLSAGQSACLLVADKDHKERALLSEVGQQMFNTTLLNTIMYNGMHLPQQELFVIPCWCMPTLADHRTLQHTC
jgi:hypothetical protein